MNIEEARTELDRLQKKMGALGHAMGLIYYDGCTTAPKGTAENRAVTLSVLSEEDYKLRTGRATVELLAYLEAHATELTAEEARMAELLNHSLKEMQKIPMEEYVAYQELLVEADDVWHTAKENSDFPMFEPILEKIFDTNIRFAKYCAPDKDPYDYWLNEYEEGLSREVCDRFFDTLREHIVPLIRKISEKPPIDDSVLCGEFSDTDQEKFSYWLMELQGLDLQHVGLSTTEHPFTTSLGSHLDERITTHYLRDRVDSSMFSVIHEAGHALYDTGSAREYAFTALDGGVSMGIHESQSRFYENIIGRSFEYCSFVFPKLQEIWPEQMAGYTAEDFYRAVNKVTPSLIRTEADEVTYALHVMIRYELEKAVMAGELTVHELPEAWNRLYKEYLGVDVPDDRQGLLQDSHWSGGMIGYFPSYALGSAYGAQFLQKMKDEVDVEACVAAGDFGPINAWNREHIWKYGCLYKPGRLLQQVIGEFDPTVFTAYLEEKYSRIYDL